jgi:hypothetical protein
LWHIWGKGAYNVLLGIPKGNRQFGIPRCKQDDNIIMSFKEDGRAWTGFIWPMGGACGRLM